MRNRINWYKVRYMALAVTLLVTAIGVYHFSMEISGVSADLFATNLKHNSQVFSMYLDDYMQERISRLEDTASSLAEKNIIKDTEKVQKKLKEKQRDFAVYTLLKPTGEKEFDSSDDITMNFNLVKSEYLDTLVQDKKTIVYNTTVQDGDRVKYAAVCSPVQYNGKVAAILMGAIRLTDLNELMKKWEMTQEGCAFLMTDRGHYITSGEKFYELLGGEANDFFTYIDSCSMKEGSPHEDELEQSIQGRKDISLRYTYVGRGYDMELCPVSYNNWYQGYLIREKSFYKESFNISSRTAVLLAISGVLWLIALVYGILLVYQFGKEREQLERYKSISKLDKSILFEMRFAPKRLRLYGDLEGFFSVNRKTYSGEEIYDVYNLVHPEDISVRKRLHQFYEDAQEVFSAEVRIQTGEGKYGWFRIIGTLIKDPHSGMNQRFVGKIESADEEIADEKNLVERAENDLLTGVLNKKTMEERVVKSLENIGGSSYRIFFMVDLDNFKNVNDKLGHIMGDKAIVDTAERLSEIFHRDAYVGRLGGDEFAVCAFYESFDEESLEKFIRKKADKICECNRRTYTNGDMEVSISSSVGIAVAPDMAADFETLYKKADSALYKSKNGGKNCYHIYGKD